jgi:hypothetical protein
MIKDPRKVKNNLQRKGFIEEQGAKHIHYIFVHKGIEICRTKMSRNDQDLNDYLLSKMQKQLKLDKIRDFIRLIDCPMSEEEYIDILKYKDLL